MIEFGVRIDMGSGQQSFRAKLNRLAGYLQKEAETAIKEMAELYYEILISHIGEYRGGMVFPDVSWQPLSQKWLAAKRLSGWTEEIWEATGGIKGSIRIFGLETKGDTISIFVGLKDVPLDILLKAMKNEFGLGNPDRPLFEPSNRELLTNTHYRAKITTALKKPANAAVGKF